MLFLQICSGADKEEISTTTCFYKTDNSWLKKLPCVSLLARVIFVQRKLRLDFGESKEHSSACFFVFHE
ncbi:MAG TPA: hypothetical protein PKK99_14975, partial [Bacteroidia bacterium]|nr:hypothetical protein [Bacteroidia bacterium]